MKLKTYNIYYVLLLLIFNYSKSFSTGIYNSLGARSSGVSNSSISLIDVWSLYNNQAGIAFLKSTNVAINYESPFLIKKLASKNIVFNYALKNSGMGLTLFQRGFEQYQELNTGFAYAKKLAKNTAIGLKIDYLLLLYNKSTYSNKNILVAQLSFLTKINNNLTIGSKISNPTLSKISNETNERIPTNFRLGMKYQYSNNIRVLIELEKELQQKINFKIGAEYELVKKFVCRIGMATSPKNFSIGMSYILKNFNITMATQYHQYLGLSPSISFNYRIKT